MKIVIKHSYGFLAKCIQFFMFLFCVLTGRHLFDQGKRKPLPNHSDIWDEERDEVFGAQAKGVIKSTFKEAFDTCCKVWIYDLPENCDPEKLRLYCKITEGILYQYSNFLLHIVDIVYRLFKKYKDTGHWLEKAKKSKTRVYCLEHTARGINYALPEEVIPNVHKINSIQFKEWCDANCKSRKTGIILEGKFYEMNLY